MIDESVEHGIVVNVPQYSLTALIICLAFVILFIYLIVTRFFSWLLTDTIISVGQSNKSYK